MGIKSALSKPFASIVASGIKKWSSKPVETQQKVFDNIITRAENTAFGNEHGFPKIKSYSDYKKQVPVREYEDFKPYIEKIISGEHDVLWKGLPIYFSKTSGTTSGTKYIPITKDSISNHINSARNAILSYIHETGNNKFVDGRMIFLSGSPVLDMSKKIPTGRLSGIVNHHIPGYLRRNQLPDFETNCIEDWEKKVDAIVEETVNENMALISGIPPWVQMYFDKLIAKTGKPIKDIFPDFSLFIYGGVNFEPYRAKSEQSIGKKIDSIELFPASEGFFAYQNSQNDNGLLLLLNEGIFYEFIPASEYFNQNPTRLSIADVELGVSYALVISSNAGLWAYSIGDTVKFVSKNPYKIIVSGRIKHFTSAFGEHVIAEDVESALKSATEKYNAKVLEFTVAPQVNPPEGGLPYHEWFVAFSNEPENKEQFALLIDERLQKKNIYYKDLIKGNILKPLVVRYLQPDAFVQYMKSEGKLGGQNKVPRLTNDRKIADELKKYVLK